MTDAEQRRRARERRDRIEIRRVGFDDAADVVPIAGADAVSLAYRLTRETWQLAGRAFPSYDRTDIPVRFRPQHDE